MTKINRVGERSKANNGQWMKIIEYNGYGNLTIQFDDGTIVYNKRYDSFKKGTIENPNNKLIRQPWNFKDKVGETNTAINGQKMTIIEYINYNNVTILFEDGTIVKNKCYKYFKSGHVTNPNYVNSKPHYRFNDRTGEESIATNGQKMTIKVYRRSDDIDVQFEDGTIVYNKSYDNFKIGQISNPNCKISSGISINEFSIYYYLKKYSFIKKEKGSLKDLGFGKMELDCYHPDYKIAIEYDGNLHATKQNNDKRKNKACKQNGITIIRIREPKCPVLNDNSIEYRIDSDKRFSSSFESALKEVFKYINSITELNIDENISFEHDRNIILKEFNKLYVNKDINSRLGETAIALNSQRMTIIAYRGYNDIDIQFEDGTIVYHRAYANFKKGVVKNPNYNPYNRIGEKRKANNGQMMEIIAKENNSNITIKFEDGTIVYSKRYDSFKKGKIKNPNFKTSNLTKSKQIINIKNKLGETTIAMNGQKMTIIAYRGCLDIDVQFEDGTIVYHRRYQEFKNRKIANPNYTLCNRIGEENIANNGQKITIIRWKNCKDIDVQFEDETIVYNKSYRDFKKGYIKNPNYKPIKHSWNYKNRIGEINVAKNGQRMEIIEYFGANNITVKYEDGSIIYNKSYNNFKTGKIANPNYNPYNRVGEKRKANNGQWMTIITYRSTADIDIQFEDGTIVKNKNYNHFKKGIITNPNCINPNKIAIFIDRTGESTIARNGQKMTIITYRSATDIDVQFEDGTIVCSRTYGNFKIGNIANPNFKKVA